MNYDNHPQDAYELGRAAVARLKEQDEELSNVLPNKLEELFADNEFKEAIDGSGVNTDELQSLTPIASYELPFSLQQKEILSKMQEAYLKVVPWKKIEILMAENISEMPENSLHWDVPSQLSPEILEISEIQFNSPISPAGQPEQEKESTDSSKPFECSFCEKRFRTKKARGSHELNHKNSTPLHCDKCDKNFSTRDSLRSHKRDMHRKDELNCNYCEKTFKHHGNLTEHIHRHMKFRQFQCKICPDAKFYVMKNVKSHFSKRHPEHSDLKNFITKLRPVTETSE